MFTEQNYRTPQKTKPSSPGDPTSQTASVADFLRICIQNNFKTPRTDCSRTSGELWIFPSQRDWTIASCHRLGHYLYFLRILKLQHHPQMAGNNFKRMTHHLQETGWIVLGHSMGNLCLSSFKWCCSQVGNSFGQGGSIVKGLNSEISFSLSFSFLYPFFLSRVRESRDEKDKGRVKMKKGETAGIRG